MALLVLLVLILGITGHSTANWCVCKDGMGDSVLQKALDYACGAGADCNPIHTNGQCFNPNTVKAHCSYAVNSYFQKKGQAQGSCEFAGAAAVSTTDPSIAGCSYPASASATGSTTATPTTPVTTNPPGTTTPSTTTPSTNTPTTTTTPYTTTPSTGTGTGTGTGVLGGGVGTGLGPSGAGMPNTNTDYSHGGLRLQNSAFLSFFIVLLFWGLMLMWG